MNEGLKNKVVSAQEAIAIIRTGDVIASAGFVGTGTPDELLEAIEKRFIETKEPKNLTLVFAAGQGDGGSKGLNRLGHVGLLKRVIGGHFGLIPKIGNLVMKNEMECYNLPQGVICHLYRSIGARSPGVVTKVGLGTFVDPRLEGGKANPITKEDIVEVVQLKGEEFLYYKYPNKVDVALIRGTTADYEGNITMEKEALTLDGLAMAIAAKNSGGYVICQVERLADVGTLNSRQVKVPGILVDCVVVAKPENHMQTYSSQYNPALSGELRIPIKSLPGAKFNERKIICRRGALELQANAIVNLGIGMPEGVSLVANEEGVSKYITLTAEPGVIGGLPLGGLEFGTAINTKCVIEQAAQFDFYDGGGLDIAFLGMAQVDEEGNINVSRFGTKKLAGCGGFINISQNAKAVVFLGTFTAQGLEVKIENGKLTVIREGRQRKFIKKVDQITFSAKTAKKAHKPVLYITERCVFKLTDKGLELTEVAPGINLERDILAHMDFKPIFNKDNLPQMDPKLFDPAIMQLKRRMLTIPYSQRFGYDPDLHILFENLEGIKLRTQQDVRELVFYAEQKLKEIAALNKPGRLKVFCNYDNFSIDEDVFDMYTDKVKELVDKYKFFAIRYTTSAFLRMKFGQQLGRRNLSSHIFDSETQAKKFLNRVPTPTSQNGKPPAKL